MAKDFLYIDECLRTWKNHMGMGIRYPTIPLSVIVPHAFCCSSWYTQSSKVCHNLMVFHDTPRYPLLHVVFYGTPWSSRVTHGLLCYHTVFLDSPRLPWHPTVFHIASWTSMVSRGTPRSSMLSHAFRCTSWPSIVPHGISWYLTFFHGTSCSFKVLHGPSWYHDIPRFHDLPWYPTIPWFLR